MGKLKELKEKRSTVFQQVDELRKTADGREMTAEEQSKWETLLLDYDKADQRVQQEERFEELQSRQIEQAYQKGQTSGDGSEKNDQEYRGAFSNYLLNGESGTTAEMKSILEKRAGITGIVYLQTNVHHLGLSVLFFKLS